MKEAVKKVNVLLEALPYIQRFHGKVVVVKYGGSILESCKLKESIARDIAFMKFVGIKTIVIHGGGPLINEAMKKKKKVSRFVEGLRVTDKKTLKIVRVMMEDINSEMVTLLKGAGAKAIGLDGSRNNLIKAEKLTVAGTGGDKIDIGYVGSVTRIGEELISFVRESEVIPVVAPLGKDESGQTLNINADEASGKIASALSAEKLVFLTDVPGIMHRNSDGSSLISTLRAEEAEGLIESHIINRGMVPKVRCAISALNNGLTKAHIIDGGMSHSLLLEIFTDKGIGTEITR